MNQNHVFNFKTDISYIHIPEQLNNPFGLDIPDIASIAAKEFQEYITIVSQKWQYDFDIQKGKMFGILVIQKEDNSYAFLGAISGKLPKNTACGKLAPSIFDESANDYFINKGMEELTEISNKIKTVNNQSEIIELRTYRKSKSIALQQQLFENYQFLNLKGIEKNLLQIFKNSSHGNPPSGAGECTAPKLLQYAFQHQLKPIALAEFWWGNSPKNKERKHKIFYPACKNKCRPILEYMLDDNELYKQVSTHSS